MLEKLLEDRCVSTTRKNCWRDSNVKGLTPRPTTGTLIREHTVHVHTEAMVLDWRGSSRGCLTDITSEKCVSILVSSRGANHNQSCSNVSRDLCTFLKNTYCEVLVCQLAELWSKYVNLLNFGSTVYIVLKIWTSSC